MPSERRKPLARLVLGNGAGDAVGIHGLTNADIGHPMVHLTGYIEGLGYLTPQQALALAEALLCAVAAARETGLDPVATLQKFREDRIAA
jgi:hypothetical protein